MDRRALRKFKSLFKKHFNEVLPKKENQRLAEKLLRIYAVVYDVSVWSSRTKLIEKLNSKEYELERGNEAPKIRNDNEGV